MERPYWGWINLGSMLAILCWLAAFAALASSSVPDEDATTSAIVGRLAVLSLAFGAAITSLQFLADGYALPELADRWMQAPPAEREDIVRMGDILHALVREPIFAGEPVFLFGLPFALIGLRAALDRGYPAWFGWSGFAVGAATLVTGATWFAGIALIPELALWAALQPLEWLWLLVLGVVMWRRSRLPNAAATPGLQRFSAPLRMLWE